MTTAEDTTSPPPAPASVAAIEEGAFYEKFENADLKTFASGYKSAEEIAALAHKFHGLKDADPAKLTALPEKIEKIEDLAFLAPYAAKDAAEYGFDKLEDVDPEFAGAMAEGLKELGLPPVMGQQAAQLYQAVTKKIAEGQAKAIQAEAAKEVGEAKKELGTEGLELARRGMRYLRAEGFEDFDIAAVESSVGAKSMMKLAKLMGARLAEGEFVEGGANKQEPTLIDRWYAPKS